MKKIRKSESRKVKVSVWDHGFRYWEDIRIKVRGVTEISDGI